MKVSCLDIYSNHVDIAKIPLEQRAHFYTGASPVCALCEADSPDDGSPGCFASLRSEQGAGLACRLGQRFKMLCILRSPPETRAPLRRYAAIPADLSFGNGFDKPFPNDKSEKLNTLHRPFTDLR